MRDVLSIIKDAHRVISLMYYSRDVLSDSYKDELLEKSMKELAEYIEASEAEANNDQ